RWESRMKIALYQDVRGGTVGGGEYCHAVLARAWIEKGYAVDYVHHQESGFVGRIVRFFDMGWSEVGDRPLQPDAGPLFAPSAPFWRRASAMRDWQRSAS